MKPGHGKIVPPAAAVAGDVSTARVVIPAMIVAVAAVAEDVAVVADAIFAASP